MRISTSKSKNSESFYITRGFINNKGVSTSVIVRKLGTLKELLIDHGPTRDDVMIWAKEQARLETEKYNLENENKNIQINFSTAKQLEYDKQTIYSGGYLFLQSIYYKLQIDKICRKIKDKTKITYDLNSILSDLIYTRILDPSSKVSSYEAAKGLLEPPKYDLHHVYRALTVLAENCDLIQSEVYKNSHFATTRNDSVLYYDCTNYYFEIEQEDEIRKYGKSKEHRPNPIVQMGMFMDASGLPLGFSIFPGNQNEQQSLQPLEKKILNDFKNRKFIYCSDAGLGSESNRNFNHLEDRSFIVTQSIKKLKKEEKEWALNKKGFRRVSDNKLVNLDELTEDDYNSLFYKEEPYTTKKLEQRLIVTYSPKYDFYQKIIRNKKIERAKSMVKSGKLKKDKKNPNDPARFIDKIATTSDGEIAEIEYYINQKTIDNEEQYDGLYAISTDLYDDKINDIIQVSERRWQIEECFRIMKTEFSARPVYVRREDRITAHFLICFLSLLIYRILEHDLDNKYTCEQIISKLKEYNLADVEEQGFIPLYKRDKLTDDLHSAFNFRTDNHFITKSKMKNIEKITKER